jgi:hypothetical protein
MLDFKYFQPVKDATITVTRPLTRAERRAEQILNYSDYVARTLFNLHKSIELSCLKIKLNGSTFEVTFNGDYVNIYISLRWEFFPRQLVRNGSVRDLSDALVENSNLCSTARLLKLAYKQINDANALKGNKPQQPIKPKQPTKNQLEQFKKEFDKLKTKFPEVNVYGDMNGYVIAVYADL